MQRLATNPDMRDLTRDFLGEDFSDLQEDYTPPRVREPPSNAAVFLVTLIALLSVLALIKLLLVGV